MSKRLDFNNADDHTYPCAYSWPGVFVEMEVACTCDLPEWIAYEHILEVAEESNNFSISGFAEGFVTGMQSYIRSKHKVKTR